MLTLTKPQRAAVHKVFLRYSHPDNYHVVTDSYRVFRKRVQSGFGCVMLQPVEGDLWLGIEPDGYTHS